MYVTKQLGDYKSAARDGSNTRVMRGVAQTRGDDDVRRSRRISTRSSVRDSRLLHELDLEQFRPALSGDKQPIVSRIVGDAVEHVIAGIG